MLKFRSDTGTILALIVVSRPFLEIREFGIIRGKKRKNEKIKYFFNSGEDFVKGFDVAISTNNREKEKLIKEKYLGPKIEAFCANWG